MTRVRSLLTAFLAIAAIFSSLTWSDPGGACPMPMPAAMAMPASHHMAGHHPAPVSPRMDCAVCLAVLPSLPAVGAQHPLPFTAFAQPFQPLSGIDPTLDPPPPRGA